MTTTQPLVTVILTTYNRARILGATIESVLAQTYAHTELIVVDDGSTDATPDVLARYGSRLRVIRQQNQGVELARRAGVRAAQGVYVAFLDDDDLLYPDKLARQVAQFASDPACGLVHCQYDFIDAEGALLETSGPMPAGDVLTQLLWGCFPWSGGPLVRRDVLAAIGDDEHRDWWGDWGMWLRVALAGHPFGCVQEPLGAYRIVAGSMTDYHVANCERLVFNILEQVFDRWQLPAAAHAERNAILAGWYCWLAWRYALGGFWESFRRSLRAALSYQPQLANQPDIILQRLYWDATSPRVRLGDPMTFAEAVLTHMPADIVVSPTRRDDLLGHIHQTLAFSALGRADDLQAANHLHAAYRHAPARFAPEPLARAACEYAARQPVSAAAPFARRLAGALPATLPRRQQVRARLISDLRLATAFRDYASGNRRSVPAAILLALRERPAIARNRGVVALLARSIPALLVHR